MAISGNYVDSDDRREGRWGIGSNTSEEEDVD